MESKCFNTNRERSYLMSLFGTYKLDATLQYQGSRDGWMNKDFN